MTFEGQNNMLFSTYLFFYNCIVQVYFGPFRDDIRQNKLYLSYFFDQWRSKEKCNYKLHFKIVAKYKIRETKKTAIRTNFINYRLLISFLVTFLMWRWCKSEKNTNWWNLKCLKCMVLEMYGMLASVNSSMSPENSLRNLLLHEFSNRQAFWK